MSNEPVAIESVVTEKRVYVVLGTLEAEDGVSAEIKAGQGYGISTHLINAIEIV